MQYFICLSFDSRCFARGLSPILNVLQTFCQHSYVFWNECVPPFAICPTILMAKIPRASHVFSRHLLSTCYDFVGIMIFAWLLQVFFAMVPVGLAERVSDHKASWVFKGGPCSRLAYSEAGNCPSVEAGQQKSARGFLTAARVCVPSAALGGWLHDAREYIV